VELTVQLLIGNPYKRGQVIEWMCSGERKLVFEIDCVFESLARYSLPEDTKVRNALRVRA
jgi:hypothetical protein